MFIISALLEYQAQSPDEGALVSAARNFGFVFKVSLIFFFNHEISLGKMKSWILKKTNNFVGTDWNPAF